MRKWLPLFTVCLGTFMLLVDVTIVNVALPDMAADLKTGFGSLQWVVDAYALALAALVLGTGSIADRIGHRRAYVGGLALFAAASFVCGIAPNSGALIAARAVQGVGAAAMFATTFALLNSNYQGRDRGTAYGMWGAVSGASAAVGPIVGGLLTEGISWRWIFFVNLPVSVLAIVLCVTALDDTHEPVHSRIDLPGMASFTAAAGTLTYGLIKANEDGWAAPASWGCLLASAVLFTVFVFVERARSAPMLDLELLRNRRFAGVLIAGLVLTLSAFSAFTYTSIWLQSVLGLSPIQAGLTGLPLSVSAFVVSAAIGRFLHGSRPAPDHRRRHAADRRGRRGRRRARARRRVMAGPGARLRAHGRRSRAGDAHAELVGDVGRATATGRHGRRCGQHGPAVGFRARHRRARLGVRDPGGSRAE